MGELTAMISRIQFAFTISFHILFPAFSIGLATFLAIMEGAWLKTRNPQYLMICKFWMKVFALTFGMGVVSGIVMEFQLGTNWSHFTDQVGSVLGGLFTYEVLTAFFIEAGFLGVMIFGWDRVGPRLHYLATLLVWMGVTLSAFWILSANSWMQTPTGASLDNGKFIVNSWMQVIFNPSVIPRYFHMLVAAYLTTSFVIAGISAHYLLKKQHTFFAKKCLSFALWAGLILAAGQMFIGDSVGLEVYKNQPIKTAAMEGVWETQNGAPLLLFAIPDPDLQKNFFEIAIPHGASLLNTHQWNGQLIGLKTVSPADQPVVVPVFYSFRVMVGVGLLMFLIAFLGLCLRRHQKIYSSRWFLQAVRLGSPLGFFAILTGWFTAEFGRQPWVVYGLIRTADAASPVSWGNVLTSLILIIVVYGIIFGVFYFRYLFKIIHHGPDSPDATPEEKQPFSYMDTHQLEKK